MVHAAGGNKKENHVKSVRLFFYCFFIIGLVAGINACAPTIGERPRVDLVWPLPPEKPRVKYVDLLTSSLDVGKKGGIAETLFGEEEVVKFDKPYGVAVDNAGRIYITDIGRVIMFDLANKNYDLIGVDAGTGQVLYPIGITTINDGRLFVTDITSDRVFIYKDSKYVGALGREGELDTPSGVAVDEKQGFVYVVDTRKHAVIVYSLASHEKVKTIGSRGTDPGQFNFPTNIAVDSSGQVFVSDTGNFRIQVFDHNGSYVRSIGMLGDMPGSFARPKGIALDTYDNLYVIDAAFQNFQIFDKEGRLLLYVGEGGAGPGKFLLPAGIAIDKSNRIYVVDQIPGAVQIFQLLGESP